MAIDSELVREIKDAQKSKSRKSKFAFRRKVKAVAKEMTRQREKNEDPETYVYLKDRYIGCFKKFGRAEIAACTAITIKYYSIYCLDWSDAPKASSIQWADEILKNWNECPDVHRKFDPPTEFIAVKQHDSNEVERYAKSFINATTV